MPKQVRHDASNMIPADMEVLYDASNIVYASLEDYSRNGWSYCEINKCLLST